MYILMNILYNLLYCRSSLRLNGRVPSRVAFIPVLRAFRDGGGVTPPTRELQYWNAASCGTVWIDTRRRSRSLNQRPAAAPRLCSRVRRRATDRRWLNWPAGNRQTTRRSRLLDDLVAQGRGQGLHGGLQV